MTYEENVRAIAEEMAKEHNEGIGVAQTGVIQIEWWYKHARIAIKRMVAAVKDVIEDAFGVEECRKYLIKQGLIPEQEGESKPLPPGDSKNPSDSFKFCNHHHELDHNYQMVDFGTGSFVANKQAIPLLKALNEAGLITRSHHHTGEGHSFVTILLDNVTVTMQEIDEIRATRTQFNGKKEVLIKWNNLKNNIK